MDENNTAALVLNGMCRAFYVDGDGNDITRGEKVKKHQLASYLGIAPESLSRIRKTLKES